MVDNLTEEQRSRTMSRIRSKWTMQEKRIHRYLKKAKVKHNMHPHISGNPDIILPEKKIAVFLHGCFWHKCPKHYKAPKTHKNYWLPKIERNVERDKNNSRILKKEGWRVVRIWEHEIKHNLEQSVKKLVDK
jgi:DNA mismatch endonuclease (patch repair protein)